MKRRQLEGSSTQGRKRGGTVLGKKHERIKYARKKIYPKKNKNLKIYVCKKLKIKKNKNEKKNNENPHPFATSDLKKSN